MKLISLIKRDKNTGRIYEIVKYNVFLFEIINSLFDIMITRGECHDIFTADQHFGHHNIIKYENRPFKDAKEMDEAMIQKWNKVVHRNDTVYILGDVTFSKKESDVAAIMEQLKGKKVLIRGNHDYFDNKVWTKKYFEQVNDYIELNYNGMKFCLMHYPMATWNKKHHGAIHLHGHIHSNELPFEIGGRIMNIGVDLFDYRPISIDEVIEITSTMPYEFNSDKDLE